MKKNIVFILFFLVLFWACTSENGKKDKMYLPKAYGGHGEILIFMDSVKWASSLGDTIRAIFGTAQAGSLQGEKIFTIRRVDPLKINKTLKTHKNLLFVSSFDSDSKQTRKLKEFFPQEGLKKIRENRELFMMPLKDVYAQGQQVLHIFGNSDAELLTNLRSRWDLLRNVFDEAENQRTKDRLSVKLNTKLQETITQKFGFQLLTPLGYQLVEEAQAEEQGFLWLRYPDVTFDKNIVVTYKNYTSESQFSNDSLIAWRNAICQKYLYGDPKNPDSYIITETLEAPVFQKIKFNDRFAVQIYGLWKTKNISMGGGFVSYSFVDQPTNRLYYVEGFVYAPNQPKREYLRELKAIISSLQFVQKGS